MGTAPASQFDASVGLGVDADGFARLPLRVGAKRVWVNAATGSDANDGLSSASAKATLAAGVALLTAAAGDQLMIAEGTSYAKGTGDLSYKRGFSPEYPTVIQSYDPNDAANEAKYGHAGAGRRPVLQTAGDETSEMQAVYRDLVDRHANYAIRGLDWNPGNVPDGHLLWNTNDYILFENNVFRYTMIAGGGEQARHHVFRQNTFYGMWSPSGHAQGVYDDGTTGITFEDNIFYHNGWKVGETRDAGDAGGGATMFNHGIYTSIFTSQLVARRNVFIDPSATGIQVRGDSDIYDNVFIDNPLAISAGRGYSGPETYPTMARPNGVLMRIWGNFILGDADINSANPRGLGIGVGNGTADSYVRNNLVVRSRNSNAVNVIGFVNAADFDIPSRMLFDSNLIYSFSPKLNLPSAYPSQVYSTYTNNIWDAAPSGTNISSASVAFPNPVTNSAVYSYLGCGSKDSCVAQMLENPNRPWAVQIRSLAFRGFGKTL